MGKLIFKYGVMGAGKTAEFLMKIYHEESKGNQVWVWRPELDSRSKYIETRIGLKREVDYNIPLHESLLLDDDYGNVLLFIDEAQFLQSAQVYDLRIKTLELPYTVCCYGLKTDFQGKLFDGSKALLELADEVIEIKSSCNCCNNKASFNMRIFNGEPVFDGNQIYCGGDETYRAVCPKCYFHEKKFRE